MKKKGLRTIFASPLSLAGTVTLNKHSMRYAVAMFGTNKPATAGLSCRAMLM